MIKVDNLRIKSSNRLISPSKMFAEIPIKKESANTISKGRIDFNNTLNGVNNRFVVITGPCSIHDTKSSLEYAGKLAKLNEKLGDKLLIFMRVYFEKPRTTTGWKGFVNDPYLNETNDIEDGLKIAVKLLLSITELGIPVATELLDPITAAYLGSLVSWAAIGARTTESQTHRQMASGLSSAVGFKNNSDGNLDVAVNAMQSAISSHSFLGIDDDGNSCVLRTSGNPDVHVVLRGGAGRSNYHEEDIKECEEKLNAGGFVPRIMVDCSHENSGKDHKKQGAVVQDIIKQKNNGNKSIFGIMLESHLFEGNQKITDNLEYGVSITDACIGWDETEKLLNDLYESI